MSTKKIVHAELENVLRKIYLLSKSRKEPFTGFLTMLKIPHYSNSKRKKSPVLSVERTALRLLFFILVLTRDSIQSLSSKFGSRTLMSIRCKIKEFQLLS